MGDRCRSKNVRNKATSKDNFSETMTQFNPSRKMAEFHETFDKPFKARNIPETLDGKFQAEPVGDPDEASARLPDGGLSTYKDDFDPEGGAILTPAPPLWGRTLLSRSSIPCGRPGPAVRGTTCFLRPALLLGGHAVGIGLSGTGPL